MKKKNLLENTVGHKKVSNLGGAYLCPTGKCATHFFVIHKFTLHHLVKMAAPMKTWDIAGKDSSFMIVCIIELMLFIMCEEK